MTTIEKSALTTSEKAKVIKKALQAMFPNAIRLSVTKGSGTASGWITTSITLTNLADTEEQRRINYRTDSAIIRETARQALRKAGTDFYTFTSDDGYDSEYECHSINLSYE